MNVDERLPHINADILQVQQRIGMPEITETVKYACIRRREVGGASSRVSEPGIDSSSPRIKMARRKRKEAKSKRPIDEASRIGLPGPMARK